MKRLIFILSICLVVFSIATITAYADDVVSVPITEINGVAVFTDTEERHLNGQVYVYPAGNSDRIVVSEDVNLRFMYILVANSEGKLIEIGNNLVFDSDDWNDEYQNEVTVPAGGFAVSFFYNEQYTDNQALFNLYHNALTYFTPSGTPISYKTVKLSDCYYTLSYDTKNMTLNYKDNRPEPPAQSGSESINLSKETFDISGYDYTMKDDLDGQIGVYLAGESERYIHTDDFHHRYSLILVCDSEGTVVKIGSNLVTIKGFTSGYTIPAGGFAVTTLYNQNFPATKGFYEIHSYIMTAICGDDLFYNDIRDVEGLKYKIVINKQTNTITLKADNEHLHNWEDATCTEPNVCTACGAKSGNPKGHSWKAANCTEPKTCSACGKTEGEPVHDLKAYTCTAPSTCRDCGMTFGKAKAHSWLKASCTAPKTCYECGATEGKPTAHRPMDAKCGEPEICLFCDTVINQAKAHNWGSANCVIPKTCYNCGETEGEPDGHDFFNGYCTKCQAEDPAGIPPLPDNSLYITAINNGGNYDDKGVIIYTATDAEDRVMYSDEGLLRYNFILICDKNGKITELGNNIVYGMPETYQDHITIPVGGFAVAFHYNEANGVNGNLPLYEIYENVRVSNNYEEFYNETRAVENYDCKMSYNSETMVISWGEISAMPPVDEPSAPPSDESSVPPADESSVPPADESSVPVSDESSTAVSEPDADVDDAGNSVWIIVAAVIAVIAVTVTVIIKKKK